MWRVEVCLLLRALPVVQARLYKRHHQRVTTKTGSWGATSMQEAGRRSRRGRGDVVKRVEQMSFGTHSWYGRDEGSR